MKLGKFIDIWYFHISLRILQTPPKKKKKNRRIDGLNIPSKKQQDWIGEDSRILRTYLHGSLGFKQHTPPGSFAAVRPWKMANNPQGSRDPRLPLPSEISGVFARCSTFGGGGQPLHNPIRRIPWDERFFLPTWMVDFYGRFSCRYTMVYIYRSAHGSVMGK